MSQHATSLGRQKELAHGRQTLDKSTRPSTIDTRPRLHGPTLRLYSAWARQGYQADRLIRLSAEPLGKAFTKPSATALLILSPPGSWSRLR
ncbi:uncharacterized protein SETTUDRAFT_167518 [Exserohilum turcica Et28A]|uniref:Uncharacterized protein n=1 Tax=Exserohilum turcicum (strain 28A) TaxID=671987 RepID=R0K9P1_EXST2|nr:uncharacterized protein SETTUDRAFT_167518 [Exserohilum turcica Et28A]EOA89698.1 hypothetical protein SETTUDRAFT_167518 [Exserohilum turcica Et28A]